MGEREEFYIEAYGYLLVGEQTLFKAINREFQESVDMSLEDYDVLIHVEEAGGSGIRLTDLAERTIMSRSGITRAMKRLTQKGWIKRVADKNDRRAYNAVITPKGLESRSAAWAIYREIIIQQLSERLTPTEAAELAQIMTKLSPDWMKPFMESRKVVHESA